MPLKLFNAQLLKLVLLISLCWLTIGVGVSARSNFSDLDKTKVVEQQIELVKNRVSQANIELDHLKKQKNADLNSNSNSNSNINKQWLKRAKLDKEAAQSNLDGIHIEVIEAQQTIDLISKEIYIRQAISTLLSLQKKDINEKGIINKIIEYAFRK